MDATDWDEVVEDLGPRLYRYFCLRFSPETADDLTQETLVRLVRKFRDGKFDPERGSLRMLGFGIAHYVALESRRESPEEDLAEVAETLVGDTRLEERVSARFEVARLRECIQRLTDVEQQVLSMALEEELPLADIARLLRIPEGTVKSHLFRSKKKLGKFLQGDDL